MITMVLQQILIVGWIHLLTLYVYETAKSLHVELEGKKCFKIMASENLSQQQLDGR